MKKRIFQATAVILILILFLSILELKPRHCVICDSIPYHAPCLVNLSTGEVGELKVYEPHPFKVAELNDYQQGGAFCFLSVAGLTGYRDTVNWETRISVPTEENKYEEKFFCRSCCKLLAAYMHQGYVLADLMEPQKPIFYSLSEKNKVSFRCYEICVIESKVDEKHEIIVTGTLY